MTYPKSKKILYFSLSELDRGGIETHLLQLLDYGQNDFEIVVAAVMTDEFIKELTDRNIHIVRLQRVRKANMLALYGYVRLFKNLGVDLVHTLDTRGGLFGRVAAVFAGCRVVHTVHTSPLFWVTNKFQRILYGLVESLLALFSDRVIFVSAKVAAIYSSLPLFPEKKMIVIPNGVDLNFWYPDNRDRLRVEMRTAAGIRVGDTVVLFVGRLCPEKGVDVLLDSASSLDPGVVLVLVGDGPLYAKAKEYAFGKKKFIVAGSLPKHVVRDWMLAADVLVLPSRFEAMPYTVIESMAAGIPCVVCEVGEIAALVGPDSGVLITRNDSEKLVEAINSLSRNPTARKRMGAAAREKSLPYSVQQMTENTGNVYRQMLMEKK